MPTQYLSRVFLWRVFSVAPLQATQGGAVQVNLTTPNAGLGFSMSGVLFQGNVAVLASEV